jgi:hypothetical protein
LEHIWLSERRGVFGAGSILANVRVQNARQEQALDFSLISGEIMCTKTCTKLVETDSAGLGRIPLDSLKKHEIVPSKYSHMRAIPTLASKSRPQLPV